MNSFGNDNIIYIDSPSPSIDQIVTEDEESMIEDFNSMPLCLPTSSSTTPLNSPPPNFNSRKLNKRSINLSDSILDKPSKKSKDYSEYVARGYLCLAKFREWKNNDGSYFPISVMNLCNYLRVKMLTNNVKSLDWNINALSKYQKNVLNIQNWTDVKFHKDVKDLMDQIREDKMKDDNIKKKVDETSSNIERTKEKDTASSRIIPIFDPASVTSIAPFPFPIPQIQFPCVDIPYVIKYIPDCNFINMFPTQKSLDERSEVSYTMSSTNSDTSQIPITEEPVISQIPITEESVISLISTQDVVDVSSAQIDYYPQIFTVSHKDHWKGNDEQKEQKEIQEDVNEPESFKSCYERSLSILKSLYEDHCDFHPDGCVLLPDDLHFVLNDTLYRHWALLCASGDDFVETELPVSNELEEFSKSHAVKI
ncbi:10218_t:CDS:2 [Dentiscutata erythropus]|uniref:10218_t:CDS:1 n=1 Tax=Dentiscutata erythropus TaxID=1348616 RepID=A0A9N9J1M2_9GLOM|nr:10218_t:CDS:2 [Dentiscutata erythropus]